MSQSDTSPPPSIFSGPTRLEEISDTIDFERKWEFITEPYSGLIGFSVADLDGDAVPEVIVMFWVERDTTWGGEIADL